MAWLPLKYGMVGPQVWHGWPSSMVWLALEYGMTCPRVWYDLPLNMGRFAYRENNTVFAWYPEYLHMRSGVGLYPVRNPARLSSVPTSGHGP